MIRMTKKVRILFHSFLKCCFLCQLIMIQQILATGIAMFEKQGEDSKRDINVVPYKKLKQATNKFAESNKIGSGGFGNVYRGNLDGREVAVKVLLTPGDANQVKAFYQEVDILSKFHHQHLVRLIGACPEKFAIIYEFMPGGTLEDQLVHKNMLWKDRVRIATEICSALAFIHSPDPHVVVHGDVKPANILLDEIGRSKLSDFGICRLMPISNTTTTIHHTTDVKGSFGYLDPAFIQSGKLAPSADVYSFGMVLLRLLTKGQPGHGLVEKVQDAIEEKHLENILDAAAKWPCKVAEELTKVALECCNYRVKRRPNLAEVCKILENLMGEYFIDSRYPFLSLQEETSNFISSNELGEVAFGRIYRVKLGHREVTMTMLSGFNDASQAEAFHQKVAMLYRLKHPHIVPLIGICPEKYGIVFDCKIEDTLEDRLIRKDLLWQDRTRIATEICSALVYLQEQKPEIVVHGDIHPKYVLLDASGRSMLYNFTNIGKGMLLSYDRLDPSIDVYWFGTFLLHLLSNGRDVDRLLSVVNLLKAENSSGALLDHSAKWPSGLADDLLDLVLTCCNKWLQPSISIAEVLVKLDNKTKPYLNTNHL